MKPEMREDRDAMFKIAALADGIQIAALTPGHPRPPVSPAPQDLIPFSGLHGLSGLTGTNSTHRDIQVILEINIFLKTLIKSYYQDMILVKTQRYCKSVRVQPREIKLRKSGLMPDIYWKNKAK